MILRPRLPFVAATTGAEVSAGAPRAFHEIAKGNTMKKPALQVVAKPTSKVATRRLQLRESLWPGCEPLLWHRRKEDGWSTIPRTLPLVMVLIDLLKPGLDASRVYLELWCRQSDDSFVPVEDEEVLAYACGYMTPGRNVRSLRERLDLLAKLGFIETKPNGSRKYGFVLLLHPHHVAKKIREGNSNPEIHDKWWGAFVKRASEIGSTIP